MLKEMPASEYQRWKAYERMNGPLNARRDDILAGLLMNLIANVNRDPKQKAYEIEQFIPQWDITEQSEKLERVGRGDNGRRFSQTRD